MPHQREYKPGEDLYSLLEIKPDSTSEEIKQAWHKKVFEAHPDIVRSPDSGIQRINEAHSILKDPAMRKVYDRKRAWYIAMTFKFKDRRLTVADIPDIDNPFQDVPPPGNTWTSWLKGFLSKLIKKT
jgi:curved DNA-binding protein CbpA